MAPRSAQNNHKDQGLHGQDHQSKGSGSGVKSKDGTAEMPLPRKLMLCASLWGMEASADFEHLYLVPILQNLGMPLSLVSLTGLMVGPASVIFLPCLGWLTDRGSNPQRRKTAAVFFAAGLLITGMMCLIAANLMHLNYLLESQAEKAALFNVSSAWNDTVSLGLTTSSLFNTSDFVGFKSSTVVYSTDSPAAMTDLPQQSLEVPFKAGLGMLGFVLTGVGFESMNSVVRSFVLDRSPRSEHTSLLVLGLIMASSGGVSTAALGVVDFSSLFGLSYIEGGSLTIQTSIQALVVITFVLLGLPITMLAGSKQLKLNNVRYEALIEDDASDTDAACYVHNSPQQDDQLTRSATLDTLENSIRSVPVYFDATLVHLDEDLARIAEQAPLVPEENEPQDAFVKSCQNSTSASYGTSGSTYTSFGQQQHQTLAKTTLEDIPEGEMLDIMKDAERCQPCCASSYKRKILFIALSCFFFVGTLVMFSMTTSDYVGKVIYGGDPNGAAGSGGLFRYQEGIRTASTGFLVYYASYFGISVLQSRLLALIGRRVEFVAISVIMGLAMLLLSVTARLEAFYSLTVVAGLHRACFYSVPYTVTNDVMQAEVRSSKRGKVNVGFAMSVVTASASLAFLAFFPWITPLEDYTGDVSIPLWLGTGLSFMAAISFLFIGKV
ncbi:uncharacterized protein [Littorina saxatilis]